MKLSNKEKVAALLKSLETGDMSALKYINPQQYIQHNLDIGDGIDGIKNLFSKLPETTKVNIVRLFEDKDFVFAHVEYDFFGPKTGFDIFRFDGSSQEQSITEHWDNLQETQPLNPSGRSMTDGRTEITDLDKTEENKEIARGIVDDILVHGKMEKLAGYFDGDNYIQHNPWFADQVSGLVNALTSWAAQGKTMKYTAIHKVLGEGNFALVVSEGHLDGVHSAFYDLFRIENGKVAEHWDTIEEIPSVEKHKHGNGKF